MAINFSEHTSASLGLPALKKTSRNLWAAVVLLIIVAGAFVWFLLLPKTQERTTQQDQLSKVKDQDQMAAMQRKTLSDLITKLQSKDNTQQLTDLNFALPLQPNAIETQLLITSLAKSVGVTIGNISISGRNDLIAAGDKPLISKPYDPARTLQTMSGSIYVMGNYSQLQAFLEKLENSGRVIDISDLAMDPGPNGNINLKITIQVYFFGVKS